MLRRVVILGVLVCLLIGSASAFLSGYGYYQNMTVNNTGSALSYYQMNFTVNTSSGTSSGTTIYLNSHANASLNDLRFTNSTDDLYPYWIENASSPYTVWVNVTYIPAGNSTIVVQYGNAAASAYSNGTNTFTFFEDWSGLLDTGKWTTPSGYSISGGIITVTSGNLFSQSTYNFETYTLRGRHKTANYGDGGRIIFGYSTAQNRNIGTTHVYFGFNSADAYFGALKQGTGWTWAAIPNVANNNNFYTSEIHKTASAATHTITSVDSAGTSGTLAQSGGNMPSGTSYYLMCEGDSADPSWDWVLLRNYTATEPTVPAWSGESAAASAPVAAFSANVTSGPQPLHVAFTDSSSNTPTSWQWSFDDGGANSTDQNPTKTFNDVGTYTIALTATNDAGSDGETKVDYITVTSSVPVAAFTANRTTGGPGNVAFTDSSTNTPTSWQWSFGDGTANSTDQNPVHTYAAGTFTVTLTATNAYGSDGETKTNYITITNPPVAAFHANVTTGISPLSVGFTDDSTNTPTSWQWSFDDGGANSTDQNPTRTFTTGTYTIILTATNAGGSDAETKTDYITVATLTTFPGCAGPPTNLDADGYYEDVNGNARLDWADILVFFNNLEWAKGNEPQAYFDFANDGGTITFTDVKALFEEI